MAQKSVIVKQDIPNQKSLKLKNTLARIDKEIPKILFK
jgi:hypothetical protein